MVATAWKFPGGSQEIAGQGAGGDAWANPNNILLEDAVYANHSAGVGEDLTSTWDVGNTFGFNIPLGAVIDGIYTGWKGAVGSSSGGSGSRWQYGRLMKGGSMQGTTTGNLAFGVLDWKYSGGPNEKWALTWLPSDINATNFGSGLYSHLLHTGTRGVISFDYDVVGITVYYHTQSYTGSVGYTGGGSFAFWKKLEDKWVRIFKQARSRCFAKPLNPSR